MRYIGIDLHKRVLVVAVEGGSGRRPALRTFSCLEVDTVRTFFEAQRPFRAVIEASSSYRWLYELLAPLGEVVLAHPLRLRAIAAAAGAVLPSAASRTTTSPTDEKVLLNCVMRQSPSG